MTTTISVRGPGGEIFQINLPGELEISISSNTPERSEDVRISRGGNGWMYMEHDSVDRESAANTIQQGWRGCLAIRRARQTLRELQELSISQMESDLDDLPDISDISELSDPEDLDHGAARDVSEMTRQAQGHAIHGLPRGSRNGNDRGSFWISGTTGKVLAAGTPFGISGDQRWAKGMDALTYCPTMRIVGTGPNKVKHCICNCNPFNH